MKTSARLGLSLTALFVSVALAVLAVLAACAALPADAPRFVLLGEVHDNAGQHRLRAQALRRLLADGRRTAVVFEQLPRDRDAAIEAQRQRAPGDVEALVDAAQFDRKGWGWPLHKPVFEAALEAPNSRLRGSALNRQVLRKLMREGDSAWPEDVLAVARRTPWTEVDQAKMLAAIDEGHCGKLPVSMHAPMVRAQRARDAAMAQAMLAARAAGAERVVLIAGNGHVDRDLGVPRYLEAAGVPAAQIRTVGYLEQGGDDDGRYDERVFTAPAEREDPCRAFKR